jgi:hypothetical protein
LQDPRDTFCSLFLTLQMGDVCIGMAFPDMDRVSRWIFGAYFGIRAEWRGNRRATQFLLAITEQCCKVVPDAKGIVFEVEPYGDAPVRSVLRKFQRETTRSGAPVRLTKAEAATHQRSGALAVAFGDRTPVSYAQPAMSLPEGPAGEVPLWLMVYPIEILARSPATSTIRQPIDIRALLDFLYDVMFSTAVMPGGRAQQQTCSIDIGHRAKQRLPCGASAEEHRRLADRRRHRNARAAAPCHFAPQMDPDRAGGQVYGPIS